MEAQTLEKHFDRLARLESESATGATWPSRGKRRIQLQSEPARPRTGAPPVAMGMVHPPLVAILRDLVSGKAPWPLFLYGAAGSGKTCAALALCNFAYDSLFVTVEEVCDAIMKDDRNLHDLIRSRELVVLDEIGARVNVSELEYKAVKMVADWRERRMGRVAIYISNLKRDQVATVYDDRIASRILCGTTYHLDGKDRRVEG